MFLIKIIKNISFKIIFLYIFCEWNVDGEPYHKSVINLLKSDKNLYYLFIETINHILNINMVNSFFTYIK